MIVFLVKVAAALGLARFLVSMAVYVTLEQVAPQRERHSILRDGWLTDLANFLFNGCLTVVIFYSWRRLMPHPAWLHPGSISFKGQPAIVQAIGSLAVGSFVYYWGHRAVHRVPLFWKFHAIHHSTERLDWLAMWRGHIFDTCWSTVAISTVMTLVGISEPAVIWFFAYRFFESNIEHSNIRLPIGPLKWVIPSPWFHQWHHAMDEEALNKNFSPYPVWDVLFGTAYMPAGRVPARFGTDTDVPRTYLGQLTYPLGLASHAERLRNWTSGLVRPSAVRLRLDGE